MNRLEKKLVVDCLKSQLEEEIKGLPVHLKDTPVKLLATIKDQWGQLKYPSAKAILIIEAEP